MRAMPSPTDRTVPTSETCASASKFAIWSRMTREISAARISMIQLAFHRRCETVEFGADRGVNLLAAQLDDDSAQDSGVDSGVDGDVASGPSAKLRLERGYLLIVERAGGDDLSSRFTAMLGRQPAESTDHVAKLALAAVAGEDAQEIGRDRVKPDLRRDRGEGLARLVAADERARRQLGEILRIDQRLAEGVEAPADGIDLPLITGKVEQSRGISPC